jgi:hypothetical protein
MRRAKTHNSLAWKAEKELEKVNRMKIQRLYEAFAYF